MVIPGVFPLEQDLLIFKISCLLFLFSRFFPYPSLLLTKTKTFCSSPLFSSKTSALQFYLLPQGCMSSALP